MIYIFFAFQNGQPELLAQGGNLTVPSAGDKVIVGGQLHPVALREFAYPAPGDTRVLLLLG